MKKIRLTILVIIILLCSVLGVRQEILTLKAATTSSVTITDPPTYCQEGNWTIGDWTYIGKRCVNYQPIPTSTPTPTLTSMPVPTPIPTSAYKMPWEDKTPNLMQLPATWYFGTGMTSFRDSPGKILYYHDDVRGVGIWILRNEVGESQGIGVVPDSDYNVGK